MKKYRVFMDVQAERWAYVDAEDEEDAIEKSWDAGFGYLCHQCSEQIDVGDEPMIDPATGKELITVEEV